MNFYIEDYIQELIGSIEEITNYSSNFYHDFYKEIRESGFKQDYDYIK